VNALKYKNTAKEFVWQWLFPARQLTREEGTGEMRRYHLHPSHVHPYRKERDHEGCVQSSGFLKTPKPGVMLSRDSRCR